MLKCTTSVFQASGHTFYYNGKEGIAMNTAGTYMYHIAPEEFGFEKSFISSRGKWTSQGFERDTSAKTTPDKPISHLLEDVVFSSSRYCDSGSQNLGVHPRQYGEWQGYTIYHLPDMLRCHPNQSVVQALRFEQHIDSKAIHSLNDQVGEAFEALKLEEVSKANQRGKESGSGASRRFFKWLTSGS